MSLALVGDNNDHQILRVLGSPGTAVIETLPANAEDTEKRVQSLGQEDPLE